MPVAGWGFNEGSGTTTADVTGGGADAVPSDSTNSWVADGHTGYGGGVSWHVPNTKLSLNSDTFSLACWARVDAFGAWGSFIDADAAGLYLEISPTGVVDLYAGADPGPEASAPLVAGQWHHIAASCNAGAATLYIDGEVAATGSNGSVNFGTAGLFLAGGDGQDLNGTIDDALLFDTALTQADVQAWMATPAGETPSAGPEGGSTATVTVTASGGGQRVQADSGGSTATVTVSASGGGTKTVTGGGQTVVTVTAAGGGTVVLPVDLIAGIQDRYFIDQDGDPILIRGDSPWSILSDLSTSDMDTYLTDRAGRGYNLALFSAVGSTENGAPNDNGATFDGVLPFTGGDITQPNETYWTRFDHLIDKANALGITPMIYPMDGWNVQSGCVFDGAATADCQTYGAFIANRVAGKTVLWSFGGDYPIPGAYGANEMFDACLTGIRSAGNDAPVTIQLIYNDSYSTQSSFWATRVDWNFVYAYHVQYAEVRAAYAAASIPALLSESAYVDDPNNGTGTANVIRRELGWAATSGSPGMIMGSDTIWNFDTGWEAKLGSTAVQQWAAATAALAGLDWWRLAPSTDFITSGAGTASTTAYPKDNDYATAAVDDDFALLYIPTARTISVDTGTLAPSAAYWIDPADGSTVTATPGSSYTTPGDNSAGDEDWYLVIEGAVNHQADGGSTTHVGVTANGGGVKITSGGSGVTVSTTTQGSGSKTGEGGSSASVDTTTSGGGVKTGRGGSGTAITIATAGAGQRVEAGQGGSQTSVTVTTTGSGSKAASGGSQTRISVAASGGGEAVQPGQGGSTTHVLVSTTGAGSKTAQGGASTTVVVTATGGGHNPLVLRDLTITARLEPDRIRSRLEEPVRIYPGGEQYAKAFLTDTTGKDITTAAYQVGLSTSDSTPPDEWKEPDIIETIDKSNMRLKLFIDSDTVPAGRYFVWSKLTDDEKIPQPCRNDVVVVM